MGEETTTSPQPGAMPGNGPATGPNATTGATPQVAALSPEEATKRIAELEHALGNAKEAEGRVGKKLSAYEKAEKERETAEQARKDAELGEVERTKKQLSDLQAQHNEYVLKTQDALVQYEVEKQAIALHIVDPEAAAILVQRMGLETDETGKPTNAKKLLEELIKNRPWLVKQDSAQDPASPAQTASQQQAPAVPPFNVSGRSSIAPPNQLPQGQPVRLNQITWKT